MVYEPPDLVHTPLKIKKASRSFLYIFLINIKSRNKLSWESDSSISVDPQPAKAADTKGQDVYGIQATFKDMYVEGDVDHSADKENRNMTVYLESTTLKGAVKDARISINPRSEWVATADSNFTIIGDVNVSQIDTPEGITINAVSSESGSYTLAGEGTLILKKS
jgi:hypothetical protein